MWIDLWSVYSLSNGYVIWSDQTVIPSIQLLLKSILCFAESRIPVWFKSFNYFECICTFNHKPFLIALSASSFEIDVVGEFDKSFPKRRMLPKNKTLPTKFIVQTKSGKTNKRNNTSKLINDITVTKEKHTIHSRI